MVSLPTISAVVFGAITLVGSIGVMYQIYQIVLLDATARGLKHPKLWGVFALGGNNSSGLIFYLIGRRKYPLIQLTEMDQAKIATRKKAAGIGLIFLAIGAIGLVISFAFLFAA